MVLQVIEKSGSVGLSEKEIKKETKLKLTDVKKFLIKLKVRGLIYKNYTERKWRLIMYKTKDEIDYNEKMRWCAS